SASPDSLATHLDDDPMTGVFATIAADVPNNRASRCVDLGSNVAYWKDKADAFVYLKQYHSLQLDFTPGGALDVDRNQVMINRLLNRNLTAAYAYLYRYARDRKFYMLWCAAAEFASDEVGNNIAYAHSVLTENAQAADAMARRTRVQIKGLEPNLAPAVRALYR